MWKMTEVSAPMWFLHCIVLGTAFLNFASTTMYTMAQQAKVDDDPELDLPVWFLVLGYGSATGVVSMVAGLVYLPIGHPKRETLQKLGPVFGIIWSIAIINLSPMGSLMDTIVLGTVPLCQSMSGEVSQYACRGRHAHWLRFVRVGLLCLVAFDFASDLAVGFELILRQDKLALGIPIVICALVFDGKALDGTVHTLVSDAATAKTTFLTACISELPIGIISIVALQDTEDTSAQMAIMLSVAITFTVIMYKLRVWLRAKSKNSPLITSYPRPMTIEEYDVAILEWKRQNLCTN
jgi:hypothetical protein